MSGFLPLSNELVDEFKAADAAVDNGTDVVERAKALDRRNQSLEMLARAAHEAAANGPLKEAIRILMVEARLGSP